MYKDNNIAYADAKSKALSGEFNSASHSRTDDSQLTYNTQSRI